MDRTFIKEGAIHAFLELHIEQGPLLEAEGLQLGIVTAIAAPAALRVTFKGGGGHAGALLMPDRSILIPESTIRVTLVLDTRLVGNSLELQAVKAHTILRNSTAVS